MPMHTSCRYSLFGAIYYQYPISCPQVPEVRTPNVHPRQSAPLPSYTEYHLPQNASPSAVVAGLPHLQHTAKDLPFQRAQQGRRHLIIGRGRQIRDRRGILRCKT